ncbi:MAG: phosphatidylinositol 4-kinase [Acidobacteriota bacterium]|nr:phosphatidylinositol 4-kinase [Acidobacteriota bacterium]
MRSPAVVALTAAVLAATLLGQPSASAQVRAPAVAAPAQTPAALSDSEMAQFLLKARVVRTRAAKKGVTGSLQATLSDGTLTHDAQIQSVDVRSQQFSGSQGVEFNFRDSWTFNIAGYRIDRLIGMNMVPVSVARRWQANEAAFTWWLDDVLMDEQERLKRKVHPPDVELWNQQMQMVRMFDQLIGNVDRNLGNLMITRDWRLWPIDHTRAFRVNRDLKTPANVTRVDRAVLERMKTLTRETVSRAAGRYLTTAEIDTMLARRDAIVARLGSLGESALFDRTSR